MEENSVYGNPLVYKVADSEKSVAICLRQRLCGHIPARVVLYFLSWSGFLVSFMLRTDINLAIVAMAKYNPPVDNDTSPDTCLDQAAITTQNATDPNEGGEFDWSPSVQSSILGSFYWAYIISQVIGGLATQKLGTKRVFGYAQLCTAFGSLLMPLAADTHYGVVIAVRFLQGFASGLTWPAMYAVVGHWIPTAERSRFMSSFQGFSIGIGLTYPLCGFLIAYFGWRSVFYTTGSIGVAWCLIWYMLAFDSPETHPRISTSERQYIADNTAQTLASSRNQKVPWKSILTSLPAWSIGITTFGRIWVHYTFIIPGPSYMKSILGFNIQQNGFLSGAPFILSYVSSVGFCYIADELVNRKWMTLKNVRKLFTAFSQVVPGILCVLIGYLGCNVTAVIIVWFIAVTLITAAYAGAMANIVDLAPNFAAPLLAFAQTIHMTASFLSPIAAGYWTSDGHTLSAWRGIFLTAAIVAFCTYIVYQVLATADVQPWNNPNVADANAAESASMIETGDTKQTDEERNDTTVEDAED